MHWPLASQFSAMLQRPEIAFRDPGLKRFRIERDRFGQPRPWTGAFAVVYQGIPPDGGLPMAVRVFTTASPERRERYDAISAYLRARRVRCLVDFSYTDEGVRAAGHGQWFPLIVMDWVQGETLYKWVAQCCRKENRAALAGVASRWIDLVAELEGAEIAHGDLQHANVMVTPWGELKLVDYDGMCVPDLVGRRNLEVGIKPYQHPDRGEQTLLSLQLDRFSAMVIYVALKALAAEPGLWRTHVEASQYDKLLFREEDLRAPGDSPLIADLRRSPDPDVPDLVEQLLQFVAMPMDRLPALRESTHPSFQRIEGLLRTQQWEAAVELLNRRGQFRDAPEHLKPLIQQAYHCVCRKDAWKAFARLSQEDGEAQDRALDKAWNESLFAGFPLAEPQRPRVEAARSRLAVLGRLEEILGQAGAKPSLSGESALVAAASALPSAYPYRRRPRVEQARDRVLAFEHLKIAVEGSHEEEAVVMAWRRLRALGCQDLVGPAWRRRIELAEKRVPLVRAIRHLPGTLPADQLDRRLLSVWKEELLEGCADVEPWRGAYQMAVRRKALLRRMAGAIRTQRDAEIATLAGDPVLAHYPLPADWTAAVQAARDRVGKTVALIAALESADAASFWERFDARLIRRHRELFAPHEKLLKHWTQNEILPPARLGLGPALARSSLVCLDPAQGIYRVRWTWPQQRFSQQCILAICPEEPGPGDEPDGFSVYYRLPIDRAHWEAGGGSRTLQVPPEWRDGYLAVWAMVDLGFGVVPSHPLVLGRLQDAAGPPGRQGIGWHWLASLGAKRRHPASGGPQGA